MKNRILTITRTSIPYVKELMPLAHSIAGCILMQQLDYWFERYPDGFYKFLAPSEAPQCREGESWCEELEISMDEFRTAFDRIGVRYKSKTEFMQAADPFQGRFYASYFDRRAQLTYYFRNHDLLDQRLDDLVANGSGSSGGGGRSQGGKRPEGPAPRPATPPRQGQSTVNGHSQSTVNPESQFTVDQESQATQMGLPDLQETGNPDSACIRSSETTVSETSHRPLPNKASRDSSHQPEPSESPNTVVVVQEKSENLSASEDLAYPSSITPAEKSAMAILLSPCPADKRQQVLDELAGAIAGGVIKRGPIPYLRALTTAAQEGRFVPNLGINITAARKARAERLLREQQVAMTPPPKRASEEAVSRAVEALPAALRARFERHRARGPSDDAFAVEHALQKDHA